MKIYDITQELLGCEVYDGDTPPELIALKRITHGDSYNLSDIKMCVHNGTHIDAPRHFLDGGKSVSDIALERTVGECIVVEFNGVMAAADAQNIMRKASVERILLKGAPTVTKNAAKVFADAGIFLVGVEPQTVGGEDDFVDVHKILLTSDVVILEGLRLSDVPEGKYFLSAAPLSIRGSDGAPCRAVLIEQ